MIWASTTLHTAYLVAAEEGAERVEVGWWVLAPTLVVLALALLVAPIWPWSRRWGWTLSGMIGVTAFTVVLFTIAWIQS